jgi:hypothetical protein
VRRVSVLVLLLAAMVLAVSAPAAVARPTVHVAPLSGAEEVPSVPTRASGMTVLRVSPAGDRIEVRLLVANLHDVTMAHIHLAPRGQNGPVVAWLYPASPPAQLLPGRTSGVLATPTLTAASLVGPLAGQPLSALLDAIEAGDAYVNVHTTTWPAGEIRGQLR